MNPDQMRLIERLLNRLSGKTPLTLQELGEPANSVKECVWRLVKEQKVVSLGDGYFLAKDSYQNLQMKITGFLRQKHTATTSELKVLLNTSRKYAILLLEKMDEDRLTYLKNGVRHLLQSQLDSHL